MRGGCSFATKVKNAQDLGAEVVIISDYENESQAEEEGNKLDIKLDGALQSHIPAFEIDWNDAKKLVEFILKGE